MLAEEIGIEPGPELQGLHYRILQADPELLRWHWSFPNAEKSPAA
jgi:hypothetical protein